MTEISGADARFLIMSAGVIVPRRLQRGVGASLDERVDVVVVDGAHATRLGLALPGRVDRLPDSLEHLVELRRLHELVVLGLELRDLTDPQRRVEKGQEAVGHEPLQEDLCAP